MLQKIGDQHLLDVQNPVNNGMNDQPQLVSWISSINSLMDDHYGLFIIRIPIKQQGFHEKYPRVFFRGSIDLYFFGVQN